MHRVLVLNATLEPLNTVSVPRAVSLLLEAAKAQLRSQRATLPVPLDIRLVTCVRIPRLMPLIVTRRGVFTRDNYTCQYCGRTVHPQGLTLDHVLPCCRGGKTTWENIVAACKPCNHRKNDRTPAQAHMRLLCTPFRPRYLAMVIYDMPTVCSNHLGRQHLGAQELHLA